MPRVTSGKTASKIKTRIRQCDKFILLATNSAVESKWCNWELGYGDSQKFDNNDIAILPLKKADMTDSAYKGNEYMQIYPYIAYYEGFELYTNGNHVKYVCQILSHCKVRNFDFCLNVRYFCCAI